MAVEEGELRRWEAALEAEAAAAREAAEADAARTSALERLDGRLSGVSKSEKAYVAAQRELVALHAQGAMSDGQLSQRLANLKVAFEAGAIAVAHHGRAIVTTADSLRSLVGTYAPVSAEAEKLRRAEIALTAAISSGSGETALYEAALVGVKDRKWW